MPRHDLTGYSAVVSAMYELWFSRSAQVTPGRAGVSAPRTDDLRTGRGGGGRGVRNVTLISGVPRFADGPAQHFGGCLPSNSGCPNMSNSVIFQWSPARW